MFPRRVITVAPPEYPALVLRIWANPTGGQIRALFATGYADQTEALEAAQDPAERARLSAMQDGRQRLGAALVASYDGQRVVAYGHTFDFSTPGAAVDTILSDALPDDLRYWLLNAPVQVPQVAVESLGKAWASSFGPATTLTATPA